MSKSSLAHLANLANLDEAEDLHQTCSGCRYYTVNPQDLQQGTCLVNPPTVTPIMSPNGLVINGINPPVPSERPACRFFKRKSLAMLPRK